MSIFNNITYVTGKSTASVIVLELNANGLTEWKLKDGTTLKDFESDKKITHANMLYTPCGGHSES